jgi:NAD+ synthase (glutamine-hydrolysing)
MDTVRIALGQINSTVGDLKGNSEKILLYIDSALEKQADIIVFPELALTGYPPEDLLLKPHFIDENIIYLKKIISNTGNIIVVLGFAYKDREGVYNSAAIIHNKKLVYKYYKMHLPNYGVFDEKRYFKPGNSNVLLKPKDFSFSVNICEDIWVPEDALARNICRASQFLINISASPYHVGKMRERREILSSKAAQFKMPIVYCNLVGGQDELIFDGRSSIIEKDGKLSLETEAFKEDLTVFDLTLPRKTEKRVPSVSIPCRIKKKISEIKAPKRQRLDKHEEIYAALVLGVNDYVRKNGFQKVAFGLSGGIDSALVACIAVDALGKHNILALSMPSRYSSAETQHDAETLARNLGIRCVKIPIDGIFDAYLHALQPHFKGMNPDIAEENIQARIRGNILMAFSNKFGYLILNTGNKSETSIGYCTLYGDMAGGFAVIKDVPKKIIYELAEYKNKKEQRDIVPQSVFKRPPSAELRPGQKDEDTIPPYHILDRVIDLYVEQNLSFKNIVKEIKDENVVRRILHMIDMNEYKRRQAAPGIKITPRAFGRDRRMPITNKFKEALYGKNDR